MSEVSWEAFQLPNLPIYKTKLSEDWMSYLWSCIKQAEKDNVDNSNDYSYRLAGNITGSLGLKDPNNKFRDEVVGPLTQQLIDEDPNRLCGTTQSAISFKSRIRLSVYLY